MPSRYRRWLVLLVASLGMWPAAIGIGQAPRPAVFVTQGAGGRLEYGADAQGNRVVDFSHAGYRGGGVPLPDAPVRLVVGAGGDRDGERVQAAIDLVSAMPVDAGGLRGAVLLEPGTYDIEGDLRIAASGVVLRGSGSGERGTVLRAVGTSRRSLIVVSGVGERVEVEATRQAIAAAYVPVGARSVEVRNGAGFRVGDRVIIRRPSTREWIAQLGMDRFPGWRPETRLHWQPASRDIEWDRIVTAVDGGRITVDAPLTTALDATLGGGTLARYQFPGRIARAGVENLQLVSGFDPARAMDEDHAWFAITLDNLEDGWVRQVSARHFVSYVINAERGTRALTVEDVEAREPVSEIGGYRRRVFYTAGQLTLFRRCRSDHGRRDFAVGFMAAGPNVFLECSSTDALDYSGPLESWASGVLFDNVRLRGNGLRLINRGTAGQGSGWAAANSVLWNCEATDVEVQSPPGAINQAYGCKGVVTGDGIVYDPRTMPYRDFYRGMPVEPRSLYLAQLSERLGPSAVAAIAARAVPVSTIGVQRQRAADVEAWARARGKRQAEPNAVPLAVEHGQFRIGGERAWTKRVTYSWFQAQMPHALAKTFGPALTRFAPGRTGVGLTDDLDALAAALPRGAAFYQHYGLWYDRRRVDHNYYGSPEQRTGDVWAPFIELPWSRSGTGRAWDGLSKYDLTRFNPWYFERVKTFADLADRRGLILYHHFYFQHWLLESRAHYVDFPWRPVNTIQATELPDEVPAASTFYDVTHPVRRDLHRRYIRHVLDVLGSNTNVVFGIDREYTGSLAFVEFWLDTIAEWQRDHGRTVRIVLEVPKAQMDAILADPTRGPMITGVDVLGWTYRADGDLFAIRGDLNRAPREQRPDIASPAELEALRQRLGQAPVENRDFLNGPEYQRLFDQLWASSKPMRYRGWREYRDRHPALVLLTEQDEFPELTQAIERAIPAAVRAATRPAPLVTVPRESSWCMARPGETYVVYAIAGAPVTLDLTTDATSFSVTWIGEGTQARDSDRVSGGRVVTLTPPASIAGRPAVAWLARAQASAVAAPPVVPAFPGAQGFGASTPGGRGGRVLVVRSLADAGPGSFRDAVTARGPRIVVFAVAGLITLESPIEITEPFLTVAGQSAPGDGVCLRGHQVSIRTHDVIVRYLRFRPGDIAKVETDGLDIMGEARNVIVDHSSVSWATDENLSPSGAIADVTLQWNIIAESLNRSVHAKGAHGYGSLVRAVGGVTLHHNLWAHNSARNPRLGDNYGKAPYPVFDVVNNVIYDYGDMASGMMGDRLSANYVSNYIRTGPSSDRTKGIIVPTDTADATFFAAGNVFDDGIARDVDAARLLDRQEHQGRRLVALASTPFQVPAVATTDAAQALAMVLENVGATLPRRDAVDARIVTQVRSRTGRLIDSQADVGGWPVYRAGAAEPDVDVDGLPDAWEREHGLSPTDAADSAALGPDGYARIEQYLNALVASTPEALASPRETVTWTVDNLTSIGGHAVTVIGAPQVVERDGYRAVAFNGTSDGLLLDVNPLEGLERFTLEAIIAPDDDGPPEQRFTHIEEAGSGNRAMLETRLLPDRTWSLDTFLKHGEASLTLLDRARTHPAAGWHAVALTFDGATMTHYVNGVSELTGPVAFKPLGAGRMSLGVRQNRVSWFKGRIRVLRITPDVLTPDRLLRADGKP